MPNFDFDSARWVVWTTIPYQSVTVYTTGNDTTIGSRTYTTISSDFYDVSGSDTDNLELLIRPDTNNRIWYRYASTISSDTNDYILYDFSLQVGDTFITQGCLNLGVDTFTVFSAWGDYLNDSSSAQGWGFNESFSQSCFGIQQLEMVGSTTHPFYPLLGISTAFDTCLPNVACYESFGVCLYGPSNLCDADASISELLSGNIAVYPNPALDYVVIAAELFVGSKKVQLNLFDVYGGLIRSISTSFGSAEITIPRNGLASGIYFIEISDERGHFSRIKFAFL